MTSDGSRTLTWDEGNRLKTATIASATTTFLYGPDDARAKKSSSASTILYPDASVEIDNTVPSSPVYTRYPHPDIKVVGTTKQYLHADHLASIRVVTFDNGQPAEFTGYAAYGEQLNTGFQTKQGYIDERLDAETGLSICMPAKEDCGSRQSRLRLLESRKYVNR